MNQRGMNVIERNYKIGERVTFLEEFCGEIRAVEFAEFRVR